jgi:hypothetical protein
VNSGLAKMENKWHITRADQPRENEGREISAKAWLSYIAQDNELVLSTNNGPYFAYWFGESEEKDQWLDWSSGNIFAQNPDKALLLKMLKIAKDLEAKVRAEDGQVLAMSEG